MKKKKMYIFAVREKIKQTRKMAVSNPYFTNQIIYACNGQDLKVYFQLDLCR